jgi:hypothetical protein
MVVANVSKLGSLHVYSRSGGVKNNESLVHAAVIAATTVNESFSLPPIVIPTF